MATTSKEVSDEVAGPKRRKLDEGMEKVSDSDIKDIASNATLLHNQLRHLFVELGIKAPDVENAECRIETRDFQLQAIEVLQFWRQSNGEKATRRAIIEALGECHFCDAKEILEKKWSISKVPPARPPLPRRSQPSAAASSAPSASSAPLPTSAPLASGPGHYPQYSGQAPPPTSALSTSGPRYYPQYSGQAPPPTSALSASGPGHYLQYSGQAPPPTSALSASGPGHYPQYSGQAPPPTLALSASGPGHYPQYSGQAPPPTSALSASSGPGYYLPYGDQTPPLTSAFSSSGLGYYPQYEVQAPPPTSALSASGPGYYPPYEGQAPPSTLALSASGPGYYPPYRGQAPPPNAVPPARHLLSFRSQPSAAASSAPPATSAPPPSSAPLPTSALLATAPGYSLGQAPPPNAACLPSAFNLEECKAQLITFYRHEMSRVQLLPWCNESKDINDIYVTLKLKKGSRKTLLPKNEDLVSLQTSDGMPATRILVKGVAGSGKSTLLAKLAYTWSQQKSDSPLAKYQLLFILSLREVKSGSLINEIFEQIFETNTTVSREGLEAYIESNPQLVLLLLDGFDEYSAGDLSTPDGSLQEILVFKRLRECRTILSTRPHKDLQIHQSSYLCIDVLGFSHKNVELYMKRFFSGKKEMVQGLKERISESDRLLSLSKIPVILMLMCLLWEDEQKLPDTQSELYQEFVLFLWRKYCTRQGKNIDFKDKIGAEFAEVISALGCLALEGLCSKDNINEEKIVFAENDFDEDKSLYQLGCDIGLLTRERLRKRLSRDNAVMFLHKSFQEFCAAKYWANLYTTDHDKFHSILIHLETWKMFMGKFDLLKFCCALIERDGMVSIIQHAIKVYGSRQCPPRICIGYDKPEHIKKNIVNILTLLNESKNTSDDGESRDDPDSTSDSDSDSAFSLNPSQKGCETVKSLPSTERDVLNTSLIQSFKSIFPDYGLRIDIGDKYPKATSIFHNFIKSELGSSILSTVKSITLINPQLLCILHIYADMLTCMPNVETLEINFQKSCEQNPDYLAEALGTVTLIKLSKLKLKLADQQFPIKWLSEFLTVCRTPNLQSLDLSQCNIGMAIGPLVQQLTHLQCCTQLISLDLSSAGLKENHIKTLSEFLPKIPNLQVLNLSYNIVGGCVEPLALQLQHCTQLTSLILSGAQLNEDHIKTLSEFLHKIPKLQFLILKHNTVGMAIVPLAQQLQHCPMLSTLGLDDTHITDQGVIELCHRFGSMPNLTLLFLECNDIGNTGVDALFRHIHHLTNLEQLSFHAILDNQCSDLVKDCCSAIGKHWTRGGSQRIVMIHAECQFVKRTASKYLE
ncbi:NLR family CARD domain-containing protein 4-like [Amphiura filiformis]|uniref:NLR family CARD domain-containing protein 4-like n=1 Tax=Amphiura filiformis TaxID=82378 RepID=UPI003B219579